MPNKKRALSKRAASAKPVTAAKCKMKYVCGVCKVVKRDLEKEQQKEKERQTEKKQQSRGEKQEGGGIQSSHKNSSRNHQKQ